MTRLIFLLLLAGCVTIDVQTIEAAQAECASHGGLMSLNTDMGTPATCVDGFQFSTDSLPSARRP